MSGFSRAAGKVGGSAARARWLARGAWLLAVGEVLLATRDHFKQRLTEEDRGRLVEIVRSSKGRPSRLDEGERRELRELIDKVEPSVLARRLAGTGLASRFRRP